MPSLSESSYNLFLNFSIFFSSNSLLNLSKLLLNSSRNLLVSSRNLLVPSLASLANLIAVLTSLDFDVDVKNHIIKNTIIIINISMTHL